MSVIIPYYNIPKIPKNCKTCDMEKQGNCLLDYLFVITQDFCPLKSIEGLIEKIMNLDYLTIEDGSDGYDSYVNLDDVVKVIKEYCEVSE